MRATNHVLFVRCIAVRAGRAPSTRALPWAAAELGMTLSMFFNFDNTVNDIWKSNNAKGKE